MSLKTVLPWLCAAGALAGVGALYLSNSKLNSQLAQFQAENQELQQFKAASETNAAQAQVSNEELARLRKDNGDLLRLRSEVQRLRQERQQLSNQLQTAQNQAQSRATFSADGSRIVTSSNLTPDGRQQWALYRPTNALPPGAPVTPDQVAALNACINNLRQIDGAKQQWALENSKPANTLVSSVNITPYLPNNTIPICPAGGAYTINAIGTSPTCSMPGHQLPK